MRNVFLFIILISFIGCKDNDTKTDKKETQKTEKVEKRKSLDVPNYKTWGKVSAEVELSSALHNGGETFRIKRLSPSESSFAHTRMLSVLYDTDYEVSIVVKRGDKGNLFGIRILGSYPDRVDAVFDLEKGEIVGVEKSRDFENEFANIEDFGDGWYKCSVRATVIADQIQIILGATNKNNKVKAWEAKTEELLDVLVASSSLSLTEITEQ
jgi:hypothetical protein